MGDTGRPLVCESSLSSPSSNGRSCVNGPELAWRMRARTGNGWVGQQPRPHTLRKCGDSTAAASANPRSRGELGSAAPRSDASDGRDCHYFTADGITPHTRPSCRLALFSNCFCKPPCAKRTIEVPIRKFVRLEVDYVGSPRHSLMDALVPGCSRSQRASLLETAPSPIYSEELSQFGGRSGSRLSAGKDSRTR